MTNPALDALDRLSANRYFDPFEKTHDVLIIRTALANAPEVVDIEWLKRSWVIRDTGRETVEYFMYRFPNGLKITAAQNGVW